MGGHNWTFICSKVVITMSSFRSSKLIGHLERLKNIFGYLLKTKEGTIRYRTEIPDYYEIPKCHFDWECTVYGDVYDIIPSDSP